MIITFVPVKVSIFQRFSAPRITMLTLNNTSQNRLASNIIEKLKRSQLYKSKEKKD